MGDVLLLYPVFKSVLENNPDVRITFITRKRFGVFFENIDRLEVIEIDFAQSYKGISGLYLLYKRLRGMKFDYLLDLHQNLRTWVLKSFFRLGSVKCLTYQKGRIAKKRATRLKNKILTPLAHTTERYANVFQKIGLKVNLQEKYFIQISQDVSHTLQSFLNKNHLQILDLEEDNKDIWIGIAPFAQHENKIWGIAKTESLIKLLIENQNIHIFLFGGGRTETEILEKLAKQFPKNVVCVAGNLDLKDEMQLMKRLKIMLTMDSSNMHLATLLGLPVISIWGATHPDLGFAPLYQNVNHIIQIPTSELTCRPCSVYGNKPCFRKDKACMQMISPELVKDKTLRLID